jgi:hypothetical protein
MISGPKSKFDFISKKELQKAYDDLDTYGKVAEHFGCSKGIVKRLINKYKIIPHPKWRRKYNFNDKFFSSDTEESFYWAGFISADGCVYPSNKNNKYNSNNIDTLHIKLASKDISHLQKFKDNIQSNNKIYVHQHKSAQGKQLEYCEIRLF